MAGDTWYVVSDRWWRQWVDYSGYVPASTTSLDSEFDDMKLDDGPGCAAGGLDDMVADDTNGPEGNGIRPGPIDNSDIEGANMHIGQACWSLTGLFLARLRFRPASGGPAPGPGGEQRLCAAA